MSIDSCGNFIKKCEKIFSLEEFLNIEKAFYLAKKMHEGQKRRDGTTYLSHPIAVADILISWGESVNMIIAALLHDTVEDTTLSLLEIENMFGSEVSLFVFVLTKDAFSIEANSDFFKDSPESIKIKLADRLHNMRTMDAMPPQKQISKSRETLALYLPYARILGLKDVAIELQELSHKYI